MKICAIDIHHHYVPNSLLEEAKSHGKHLGVELIEKDGRSPLSFAGGPKFVLQPELSAVDERLKMMQESKLAMAALEAHTATLGYRLTGEQGENWCNVYNEGIKELVTRYPDRFVGIASVPLQDAARAAKVLSTRCAISISRRLHRHQRQRQLLWQRGFRSFLGQRRKSSTSWSSCIRKTSPGADKMNPYGLKLICGNPADSALCFGFMTYSGVFDRFPESEALHSSRRRIFPYHLGRFDQGWQVRAGARAAKAKKPPSAYLKNIYYDNMIYRLDTIKYLDRPGGIDHIMVGTDYPFT